MRALLQGCSEEKDADSSALCLAYFFLQRRLKAQASLLVVDFSRLSVPQDWRVFMEEECLVGYILRILPGCISCSALDSSQHFSCKCIFVAIKAENESGYLAYSVNSSGEVGYLFHVVT